MHYMVGDKTIETPGKTVLYLLQRAGLMQRDADASNHLSITSQGFQFLLQNVNKQMWTLLLQYLSMAEDRNMDLVEVLAFFFTVGSLELGQSYKTADLSPTQMQMVEELGDYGLVYRPGKSAKYFYPTRLATTLTSTTMPLLAMSNDKEEQGYIILETNYRVYAYTGSQLRIAILNLFVTLKSRFPNLVVGQLTRDSVKSALSKGISAEQVRRALTLALTADHRIPLPPRASADVQERALLMAVPALTTQDPLLPVTVTDQIRLWEREMNRVTTTMGELRSPAATHSRESLHGLHLAA